MGRLVDGVWKTEFGSTVDGRFRRQGSQFRNWITRDGSPGVTGVGGFKAERDRYHLYVSYACPWAHRTLIMRSLKKIDRVVGVSIVDCHMGENGWAFTGDLGSTDDPINGSKYLYEIYTLADPKYTGKVTVPVLWDKKNRTIVNNESSEIIRMFNDEFGEFSSGPSADYYPLELRPKIDEMAELIYENVNNGVYKAGFSTTQEAYQEAYNSLFDVLGRLDAILNTNRYLLGDVITLADWMLFVTLLRFDCVYYSLFKCNKYRILDRPNLNNYLKELYQHPGVLETVNLQHIKRSYYLSLTHLNPSMIVPLGPDVDYSTPYDRLAASCKQ